MQLARTLIDYFEGDRLAAKETLIDMILQCIENPNCAEDLLWEYELEADYEMDLLILCKWWKIDPQFKLGLIQGTSYEHD
jgi:hypothetical protein